MYLFRETVTSILFLLLTGFLLGSCSGETDPRLVSAQRDMDLNPDSILSVLNRMDTTSFTSHDRATYNLLKTQALDKTNNLNDPYPGIDYALEYFNQHGNISEKMMANFYKARPFFLQRIISKP